MVDIQNNEVIEVLKKDLAEAKRQAASLQEMARVLDIETKKVLDGIEIYKNKTEMLEQQIKNHEAIGNNIIGITNSAKTSVSAFEKEFNNSNNVIKAAGYKINFGGFYGGSTEEEEPTMEGGAKTKKINLYDDDGSVFGGEEFHYFSASDSEGMRGGYDSSDEDDEDDDESEDLLESDDE